MHRTRVNGRIANDIRASYNNNYTYFIHNKEGEIIGTSTSLPRLAKATGIEQSKLSNNFKVKGHYEDEIIKITRKFN